MPAGALFLGARLHQGHHGGRLFLSLPAAGLAYETAPLPPHFNAIAKGKVRTFGAALARARELQFCSAG